MQRNVSVHAVLVLLVFVLLLPPLEASSQAAAQQARDVLRDAGVRGGLVVHIGCGDGTLVAALHADDAFLVHGLDDSAAAVQEARALIRSQGLYGKVSVEHWGHGFLPYADNTVNLVVSSDLGDISVDEVMRVLCPEGLAYLKRGGRWARTVKPRSKQIDEWTHFLYDATNNAVSRDSIVGPPRQFQWVTGPEWARSHDHLATVSAVVSSGGRVFYIIDEGPTAAVVLRPQWYLVARDAFNGVLLWKRPIPKWQWHLRGFRSGPSDLSRRLVAVADKVYVTLDIDGPLSVLDGATGETVKVYEGTEGTLEVVHSGETLFVVAAEVDERRSSDVADEQRPGFTRVRHQRPAYLEAPPEKRIVALDAETGRVRWARSEGDTQELMPTTLAVDAGRLFFQSPDEVICLDASTGEELWRTNRPTSRSRPAWSAPTLVVYGDVVLSADRAVAEEKTLDETSKHAVEWIVSSRGGQAPIGQMIAFSAEDGRRLWSSSCQECYNAPVDVLVAGGLVWTGNIVRARDPGFVAGRDPRTGLIERARPNDQEFFQCGMGHQRCYRNKATNEYLVLGRSGVEFIDVETGKAIPHHWIRGTCQYGVMPCNGLIYVPPHSCACFIRSKLNGFNCLTPSAASVSPTATTEQRLQCGPAYGKVAAGSVRSDDWPTYRHDAARSGCTHAAVSADLAPAWNTNLGGPLSSLVVAEGKLFVAQIDAHTIYALDAETGRRAWTYTAGGRVDSPPTVWQGRVLFGSADGYVYCLRASDGALAWRFRAAPRDRRIVAYEQLESLWPVPGSVLVRDGIAYCVAGRSSYVDGGIRLCRLDARTGELLSETVIDDRDPETGYQKKGVVRGTNMPGALPDVLSCDGESVYMRHRRFDLTGRPQEANVDHLFSAAGFLDGTWWHRTYWMVGSLMTTNYGGWPNIGNRVPAGRLLVVDGPKVYGFGRNQYIHHGAHVGIDGETVFHFNPKRDAEKRFTYYQAFGTVDSSSKARPKSARKPVKQYEWTRQLPVLARALVLAGDTLFFVGPPDIFSSDDPVAALEGKKGGLLLAIAVNDGRTLATHNLDSPPVFDGMAATTGRLYLATTDGQVLCLTSQPETKLAAAK